MDKKIARVKEYIWMGENDESINRYRGGTFMWVIEYESPYDVCDRECFYVNDMFTQMTWGDMPQVLQDYIKDAYIVNTHRDCMDIFYYTYELIK